MLDTKWQQARVQAGARVTFGLIDLNGFSGRRYGSAALAVQDPGLDVVLTVTDSGEIRVRGGGEEQDNAIYDAIRTLRKHFGGPGVDVDLTTNIPSHLGFGSKTLSVLNVGRAYASLCGHSPTTQDLAISAGRGGTGGASVSLIDRGGFIIDGGHKNSPEFDNSPRAHLIDDRPRGIPPVISSLPFPDWPILVITPRGVGLSGQPEKQWFSSVVPLSPEQAMRMAHIVLMNLAPSIAAADYDGFCDAVNRMTNESDFKRRQIAVQSQETQRVLAEARDHGLDAVGMSSMGPGCYGFAQNMDEALEWIDILKHSGVVLDARVTRARNTAPVIELSE